MTPVGSSTLAATAALKQMKVEATRMIGLEIAMRAVKKCVDGSYKDDALKESRVDTSTQATAVTEKEAIVKKKEGEDETATKIATKARHNLAKKSAESSCKVDALLGIPVDTYTPAKSAAVIHLKREEEVEVLPFHQHQPPHVTDRYADTSSVVIVDSEMIARTPMMHQLQERVPSPLPSLDHVKCVHSSLASLVASTAKNVRCPTTQLSRRRHHLLADLTNQKTKRHRS